MVAIHILCSCIISLSKLIFCFIFLIFRYDRCSNILYFYCKKKQGTNKTFTVFHKFKKKLNKLIYFKVQCCNFLLFFLMTCNFFIKLKSELLTTKLYTLLNWCDTGKCFKYTPLSFVTLLKASWQIKKKQKL